MCNLLAAIKRPAVSDTQCITIQNFLIEGMSAAVTKYGTRNFRTAHLRNTLCDILADLCQQIVGHRTRDKVTTQKRLDVCQVLIGEVGGRKNCQVSWKDGQKCTKLDIELMI